MTTLSLQCDYRLSDIVCRSHNIHFFRRQFLKVLLKNGLSRVSFFPFHSYFTLTQFGFVWPWRLKNSPIKFIQLLIIFMAWMWCKWQMHAVVSRLMSLSQLAQLLPWKGHLFNRLMTIHMRWCLHTNIQTLKCSLIHLNKVSTRNIPPTGIPSK